MKGNKRFIRILSGILAAYAVIIVLLLLAESGAEGSSIHNAWDAVWYSIITLTTVGYGDIAPVTAFGKVLGIILALCSLGLLTALVGLIISFVSGQAVPRMRLRSLRRSKWYVFNEKNERSAALAASALHNDPAVALVFLHSEEKLINAHKAVRIDCSISDLADIKGSKDGILYFCIGEDQLKNYLQASDAARLGISTYCLTDLAADDYGGFLHSFSSNELISRCYWRDHPVRTDEKELVLIGSGRIAAELLERGLLINVFAPGRTISYRCFGYSSEFSRNHPETVKTLSGGDPRDDRLFLYDDSWKIHPDIIRNADRIIICEGDDMACLEVYSEIEKWFPTGAEIHVRLDHGQDNINGFGSCRDTFELRSLIRDDINRLAVTLNDIYNEGSGKSTSWSDLSDHLKRSNIASADHMIVKVRYLLEDDSITELTGENCRRAYEVFQDAGPEQRNIFKEMEHRRWVRFQRMYNWKYSSVRNDDMREHPLLLPYEQLSEQEKEKDIYAWEILGKVADRSGFAPEEF